MSKNELKEEKILSVLESLFFISESSQSLKELKSYFGEKASSSKIKTCIKKLQDRYKEEGSGLILDEVGKGYQLRTKKENLELIQPEAKKRHMRLSRSSLEILSVLSYKQPCTRLDIEDIRGVCSSFSLKALMEKGLVQFAGKSDLPGKPMLYKTTSKFLEVFSLQSLDELPSLEEVNSMISETEFSKEQIDSFEGADTKKISQFEKTQYEHLEKISEEIRQISTTTEFFEDEKKEKKEEKKAFFIEKKIKENKEVSEDEKKWLESYTKKTKHLSQ